MTSIDDVRRQRAAHARIRIRSVLRSQQVAFLIVGGVNLLIGMASFALFNYLFGHRIGYMLVLVASYSVAILCAFVMQRRFVFRVSGSVWKDLYRFTLVNLGALAINAALLPLLVEAVGLPVIAAQGCALIVVVLFNYFGHSLFSFRRSADVDSGVMSSR